MTDDARLWKYPGKPRKEQPLLKDTSFWTLGPTPDDLWPLHEPIPTEGMEVGDCIFRHPDDA